MNKLISAGVGIVVFLAITLAVCMQFAHKLENQNLAIVQSMTGDVEVRRIPGWWLQISPTITEYPKAGIYRLNAADHDSLDIQFNNKSKAMMNVAIGYRIDSASDDVLIALHQQVEGNDDKIWQMVLTCLNTVAQSITTKYDPSTVIGGEKFDPMIREMYTAIIHNAELQKHGIDINYFAVDGRPIPDKDTEQQFNKQREADLSRRLAEAEKLKLEAEKIRVEANYQKEIAEYKGKADAETAKMVTEAERQKKLAEIEAQKKVEVEKLAKEQILVQMAKEKEAAEIAVQKQKAVALVEAEKLKEVAEIQKLTEAENLEREKLVAEQLKVAAEAKKIQIEKSGAITEVERVKLEIDRDTKIGVAKAYADGIGHIKLPAVMNSGTNSNGPSDALKTFFDLKNAAIAIEMTEQTETNATPAK